MKNILKMTKTVSFNVLCGSMILSTAATGSDEFYQWNLDNDGTPIRRDLDDIHSEDIRSITGMDVQGKTASSMALKKTPIVAVLDTGLDLEHPDLEAHILKNDEECENGKLPAKPEKDADGNGFKGDCMGWNFVGDNHRPYDNRKGHGTHIAGIISASKNSLGVRGIHDGIKILPLKVVDQGKVKASNFAKAIDYAVKMKADAINMSLGWPEILNTAQVKTSIQNANKKGVIIVAAAGNNNHDRPIYPCAFDYVVCVGSIDPDGKVSRFSNVGSSVDILAPGFSVLSTIPRKNRSLYFQVEGYDYKSGTSQAAPHVAAAIALIKAKFPKASRTEVLARIFGNTRSLQNEGKSHFGLLQIDKSLSFRPSTLFWPQFGKSQDVVVDASGRFQISLDLMNLSTGSKSVQISLKNVPRGINFNSTELSSSSGAPGTMAKVRLVGKASLQSTTSRAKILVEAKSGSFSKTFPLTLHFSNSWKASSKKTLAGSGRYQSCLGESACIYRGDKGKVTIEAQNASNSWRNFTVNLDSSARVLAVQKVELMNQKPFIVIQTREDRDGGTIVLRLRDLNGDLYPGLPDALSWRPEYGAPKGPLNWHFHPGHQVPVPYFVNYGKLPDLDRDSFSGRPDSKNLNHVYMLLPDESGKLITRALDSEDWRGELADKLNLRFSDFIDVLTAHSHQNGSLNLVVSVGRGVNKSFHFVPFELPENYNSSDSEMRQSKVVDTYKLRISGSKILDGNLAIPVTGMKSTHLAFIALDNERRARTLVVDATRPTSARIVSDGNYSMDISDTDILVSGYAVFGNRFGFTAVYESKSNLVFHSLKNNATEKLNIYRYSFLPGEVFAQQFLIRSTGIFINNAAILENSIGFIKINSTYPELPIGSQPRLPSNCNLLSPQLVSGKQQFVAQCGNQLEFRNL